MLSIFLVVQGLETVGVTNLLASALVSTSKLPSALGVFGPGMVVTVGASFMNNWPMTVSRIVKHPTHISSWTGLNKLDFHQRYRQQFGTAFFSLGSLAILMWIEIMQRKGVNLSFKEYLKVGAHCQLPRLLLHQLFCGLN